MNEFEGIQQLPPYHDRRSVPTDIMGHSRIRDSALTDGRLIEGDIPWRMLPEKMNSSVVAGGRRF